MNAATIIRAISLHFILDTLPSEAKFMYDSGKHTAIRVSALSRLRLAGLSGYWRTVDAVSHRAFFLVWYGAKMRGETPRLQLSVWLPSSTKIPVHGFDEHLRRPRWVPAESWFVFVGVAGLGCL